jgi:cyclic dehypoxanthinyl futalosine synthase
VAQVALLFGANDLGGTMMEENVVRAAGASFDASEMQVRCTIEGAGFRAVKRNTLYEYLEAA